MLQVTAVSCMLVYCVYTLGSAVKAASSLTTSEDFLVIVWGFLIYTLHLKIALKKHTQSLV